MPWFRCLIRGENFPGQISGAAGPVGFYVTRFVQAANVAEAEALALQSLRGEPRLAPPPGDTPSGRARVFFEEIEEVTAGQVPSEPPGFVWYASEDTEAEPGAATETQPAGFSGASNPTPGAT